MHRMIKARSMQKIKAKLFYLLVLFALVLGNEPIANSGFAPSQDRGGLNLIPGAYIITDKLCQSGEKIPVDPDTRLKMQLIVKPTKTYFFRRIDSKCTYMQYVSVKSSDKNLHSIFYKNTEKLGNCYFKPTALVKRPLKFSEIRTEAKGKELKIHWKQNPSLTDCKGDAVTWVFKRLKKYHTPKSKKLARSPLYGTL